MIESFSLWKVTLVVLSFLTVCTCLAALPVWGQARLERPASVRATAELVLEAQPSDNSGDIAPFEHQGPPPRRR